MKRMSTGDLYKLFLVVLFSGFIITFLRLLNVNNIYITIVDTAYICISSYLVFFTKVGKFKIFRNKSFEKYYENYIISGELLILGIIFFFVYIKNINGVSLLGVIFILIGLIFPYFSRKNWDN
ncbi:hypothetical protein [Parvimonas micra]|uniref:Uncharacterized protein n=1 Tax=Parvimonas micra TaxID=33033 RepID=A0A9X3K9Q4_9FIRM|nr:hypothetical protein [Parvimonas micra]MCZ7408138.1 hypothetical protein [Parvimonas micra]MCZ7411168.1 hypothetical protein [Parvimonas micra]MCZ7411935.1 hypothetical protein [Parvimonas micra]WBB37017.1 hypothetical protein NM218_00100 [Parvimonas micra]